MHRSTLDRRRLLLGTGAAALLAARPRAALTQLIGTPAPFTDYRALVCVFLFGGNDSFNMLVPRSDAEYGAYAAARQNLAIPQGDLLPIAPLDSDGAEYGLHPAMPGLQALFEAGSAAFVANVGPLVEPTTKDTIANGTARLPPQLFSHNDQQDQWHSLRGDAQAKTGWAGRIADLVRATVSNQRLATNVSLNGNALSQAGDQTVAYAMGPQGPLPFFGFGTSGFEREQRLGFERVIDAPHDSLYARAFAEVQRRALQSVEEITAALAGAPPLATPFPASPLGEQLATVARLIAVRDTLRMQRQIFFVATGGFDSHDDQAQNQPGLLGNVSASLNAFYAATEELGVASAVTAFTQSDFARTLTSNGDGTDHAWGGVQAVIGGAVQGRRIYGQYPSLALGGPLDLGGGRMIPAVSADQYAATLAKWFGIADGDLEHVAPNLASFAVRDLGFLV